MSVNSNTNGRKGNNKDCKDSRPIMPSREEDILIEIELTKDVMRDNIEKTLNRAENLSQLEIKAKRLNEESARFAKSSRSVKNRMCLQNWKIAGTLILFIFLIIVLLILFYF